MAHTGSKQMYPMEINHCHPSDKFVENGFVLNLWTSIVCSKIVDMVLKFEWQCQVLVHSTKAQRHEAPRRIYAAVNKSYDASISFVRHWFVGWQIKIFYFTTLHAQSFAQYN
jgi:hypothetical protein